MSSIEGWKFFRGGPKNGRILRDDDQDYYATGATIQTSAGRLPVLMARSDIRPIVVPCSRAASRGDVIEAKFAS